VIDNIDKDQKKKKKNNNENINLPPKNSIPNSILNDRKSIHSRKSSTSKKILVNEQSMKSTP